MSNKKKIAIVGAGAAGCFCAIELKRRMPQVQVDVYEGASKALAKVAITGGGRCNLTNTFNEIANLADAYPRGERLMRRMLSRFSQEDTWRWFEDAGVALIAQDDECVFPQSQDAMEIVNTLLRLMHHYGVCLHLHHKVSDITHNDDGIYTLSFGQEGITSTHADYVVVTTGGDPKATRRKMLSSLELEMEQPVPSLFTFNLSDNSIKQLMGTVVKDVTVMLASTRFRANGTLLITHWGVSGPAILRLSSYAARHLAENDYKAHLVVNWCGDVNEEEVRSMLRKLSEENGAKLITNVWPERFTSRHWQQLIERSSIPLTQRWASLNKKLFNRLVNTLVADQYEITGRCPFKEEFVTCGGVSLSNISMKTLECKKHSGLYFAGEVLDVDAITGGFNLQAAWSMAFCVAEAIAMKEGN